MVSYSLKKQWAQRAVKRRNLHIQQKRTWQVWCFVLRSSNLPIFLHSMLLLFCTITTHHFWRGTCVTGRRWEEGETSSPDPQTYPTAPCLVLPTQWLSSDSPPGSQWGHRAGSTSTLSVDSGDRHRGGCVEEQRMCAVWSAISTFLFTVVMFCGSERAVLMRESFWSGDLVALARLHRGNITFFQRLQTINTEPRRPVII